MTRTDKNKPFALRLYQAALIVAVFSGFGNMPLYRRYYVADLPGLGWSGDFMINIQVHYLVGALLLGLAAYAALFHLYRVKKTGRRLSLTGLARSILLGLTLLTGLILAVRNLPGFVFPLPLQAAVIFTHLGTALLLLLLSLGCLIGRLPWLRDI